MFHRRKMNKSKLKGDEINDGDQDLACYTPLSSLVSVTGINIAITSWNEPDIREHIKLTMLNSIYDKSFYPIIEKVSQKISRLCLPNSLKDEVSNLVAPIGYQILNWVSTWRKQLGRKSHGELIEYTNCRWTNQGTIDDKETLDLWLKNRNNLHIDPQFHQLLYIKACEHCLEDHISRIWDEMLENTQNSYFFKEKIYNWYKYHLIVYWTCSVRKVLFTLSMLDDTINIYDVSISIPENMLTLSVFTGNVFATKYFWHKLLEEDRYRNIVKWACLAIQRGKYLSYKHRNKYAAVLIFLLCQMDKGQLKEVFQEHTNVTTVFGSLFSDWPYSNDCGTLVPIMGLIWNFLPVKAYVQILLSLTNKIGRRKVTEEILQAMWLRSPLKFKTGFIQYIESNTKAFWKLCTNIGIVKFILVNVNIEERKRVISSSLQETRLNQLLMVIPDDKLLHVLDVLITETRLPIDEITNYKEWVMRKYANNLCCWWISNDKWQLVEEFLKWGFVSKDQIDHFKMEQLNKTQVLRFLMRSPPRLQLAKRFMEWCIKSDAETKRFKKEFAHQNTDLIVKFSEEYHEGWNMFKNFIFFCFDFDYEIDDFKEMLVHNKLEYMLLGIMGADDDGDNDNLWYGQNLVQFCYSTQQEIHQFKRELQCSDVGKSIFGNYRKNYRDGLIDFNFVKLVRMWFCPVHEKMLTDLDSGHLDSTNDRDNLCNCPPEPTNSDDDSIGRYLEL